MIYSIKSFCLFLLSTLSKMIINHPLALCLSSLGKNTTMAVYTVQSPVGSWCWGWPGCSDNILDIFSAWLSKHEFQSWSVRVSLSPVGTKLLPSFGLPKYVIQVDADFCQSTLDNYSSYRQVTSWWSRRGSQLTVSCVFQPFLFWLKLLLIHHQELLLDGNSIIQDLYLMTEG